MPCLPTRRGFDRRGIGHVHRADHPALRIPSGVSAIVDDHLPGRWRLGRWSVLARQARAWLQLASPATPIEAGIDASIGSRRQRRHGIYDRPVRTELFKRRGPRRSLLTSSWPTAGCVNWFSTRRLHTPHRRHSASRARSRLPRSRPAHPGAGPDDRSMHETRDGSQVLDADAGPERRHSRPTRRSGSPASGTRPQPLRVAEPTVGAACTSASRPPTGCAAADRTRLRARGSCATACDLRRMMAVGRRRRRGELRPSGPRSSSRSRRGG